MLQRRYSNVKTHIFGSECNKGDSLWKINISIILDLLLL